MSSGHLCILILRPDEVSHPVNLQSSLIRRTRLGSRPHLSLADPSFPPSCATSMPSSPRGPSPRLPSLPISIVEVLSSPSLSYTLYHSSLRIPSLDVLTLKSRPRRRASAPSALALSLVHRSISALPYVLCSLSMFHICRLRMSSLRSPFAVQLSFVKVGRWLK